MIVWFGSFPSFIVCPLRLPVVFPFPTAAPFGSSVIVFRCRCDFLVFLSLVFVSGVVLGVALFVPMPKRGRSEEGSVEEELTATRVERSVESGRRFEAYIKRWASEVAGDVVTRPSQMPPLSEVNSILSFANTLKKWRGSAPMSQPSRFAPTPVPTAVRTGVVYDAVMLTHSSGDPKDLERPARLWKTIDHLQAVGLLERCLRLKARLAKTKELRRVHTREHIDFVDQLDFLMSLKKDVSLSVGQDLYACEHTSEAARYAAGSVVEAARAVVRGEVLNAFAIVRPPGHHAGPDTPSGFCFYNNVAVAARAAQVELATMAQEAGASEESSSCPSPALRAPLGGAWESANNNGDNADAGKSGKPRVLILDWDVHHCDGTEKIFYEDDSVLVASIHQYGNGRGHVLRKRPSAMTPAEAPGGTTRPSPMSPPLFAEVGEHSDGQKEEMSVAALTELMATHQLSVCDSSPPAAAQPEGVDTPSPQAESVTGRHRRRRRETVDYQKLAEELQLTDDKAAAAALGVALSSKASSSSTTSSDNSMTDDDSNRSIAARGYAGDTDGLSFDHMEDGGHGNGVDPNGLEDGEELFYPGTGHVNRIGGEVNTTARGRNVNVPWPAHGFGDLEYLRMIQEVILPVAQEFRPAIVLISCGFDSAQGDLLGSMNLSSSGYYAMTKAISAHFPHLIVALEGGYNVSNVARCTEAVVRALLEDSCNRVESAVPSPLPPSRMMWCQAGQLIDTLHDQLGPYWKCFSEKRRS